MKDRERVCLEVVTGLKRKKESGGALFPLALGPQTRKFLQPERILSFHLWPLTACYNDASCAEQAVQEVKAEAFGSPRGSLSAVATSVESPMLPYSKSAWGNGSSCAVPS